MLQRIGFFITSIVLFVSCGGNTSSDQKHEVIKKDTLVSSTDKCGVMFSEAKRLDNILLKATAINPQIAEQAINAFYNFSSNCKEDTLAPVFY